MSKINKEQSGDSLPEFQNPYKNPKWWENDQPPEGEAPLEEIVDELITEVTQRLLTEEGIVELAPSPQPITKPNRPEEKRTWQPDSSWRSPITLISSDQVFEELDEFLGLDFLPKISLELAEHVYSRIENSEPFYILDIDELSTSIESFRSSREKTDQSQRELKNAVDQFIFRKFKQIAEDALQLDVLSNYSLPGSRVLDIRAWQELEKLHGKVGILLIFIALTGVEHMVSVSTQGISLDVSFYQSPETITKLLPLEGMVSNAAKSMRFSISNRPSSTKRKIDLLPDKKNLGIFHDWWSIVRRHSGVINLDEVLKIEAFCVWDDPSFVRQNSNLQTSQTSGFFTSLQFSLPESYDPPLVVTRFGKRDFSLGSLNPEQILLCLGTLNQFENYQRTTGKIQSESAQS
ncbi:MAG TPA: hypothetical protein PKJ26_02120 [Candidatus Woesebacteria bacterium]|nr:hypothetical protein [Candidatus Woesebacteria bacterium]HNS65271.1 hypothetical protein [Candidatus Woesebacteria bacterium]